MLDRWPSVLSEYPTVALLQSGKSIARFGDGEMKLMAGYDQMREPANAALGKELRRVISGQVDCVAGGKCLVGIPSLDEKGPKYLNWVRHQSRFRLYLSPTVPQYVSAFVSRPDSAPWIRSKNYAEHVVSLWKNKHAVLVAENGTAIHRLLESTAKKVTLLECKHREAYSEIDLLEQDTLATVAAGAEIAILSCGPTASCLAPRLAPKVQAIDIGSAGGFLLKMLNGKGDEGDGRTDE